MGIEETGLTEEGIIAMALGAAALATTGIVFLVKKLTGSSKPSKKENPVVQSDGDKYELIPQDGKVNNEAVQELEVKPLKVPDKKVIGDYVSKVKAEKLSDVTKGKTFEQGIQAAGEYLKNHGGEIVEKIDAEARYIIKNTGNVTWRAATGYRKG